MKKSLIAMTIAAAAAAPMAANAAVTTYAQIQAEVSNIEKAGGDATISMDDKARGRIGFKGSEELGNGMSMIGKLEYKINTTDGTFSSGSRESMVGLKQGWGTFMMGRIKSPYKYLGGVKYDPFVATTLESRGVTSTGKVGTGNAMGHNGFMTDNIGLRMMGGKLQINVGVNETGGNQGDITIGYKHKMGKKNELVFAHIAHSNDADQAASGADYASTKVGGKFGAVKFQVESSDADGVADTSVFVSYGMKMAGGKLIVQGGIVSGDTYENGSDLSDVTVGYIKKFTKKARWFAGFRSTTGETTDGGAEKDNTTVTYGMRFDY